MGGGSSTGKHAPSLGSPKKYVNHGLDPRDDSQTIASEAATIPPVRVAAGTRGTAIAAGSGSVAARSTRAATTAIPTTSAVQPSSLAPASCIYGGPSAIGAMPNDAAAALATCKSIAAARAAAGNQLPESSQVRTVPPMEKVVTFSSSPAEGRSAGLRDDGPAPPGVRAAKTKPLRVDAPPVATAARRASVGFVGDLGPGARVEIVGLTGAKDLNSLQGKIDSFDQMSSRWQVMVDGVGPRKVRAENLNLLAPAPDAKWKPRFPIVQVSITSRKIFIYWVKCARQNVAIVRARDSGGVRPQKVRKMKQRRPGKNARVDRVVELFLGNQDEIHRLCLRDPGTVLETQLKLLESRIFALDYEVEKLSEAPTTDQQRGPRSNIEEPKQYYDVRTLEPAPANPPSGTLDERALLSWGERFDLAMARKGQWKYERDKVQIEAESASKKKWLEEVVAQKHVVVSKAKLVAQFRAEAEKVRELLQHHDTRMRRLRERHVIDEGEAYHERVLEAEKTMAQAIREQREFEKEQQRRLAAKEEKLRLKLEMERREREEALQEQIKMARIEGERRHAEEAEERRRVEQDLRLRREEEERYRLELLEQERLQKEAAEEAERLTREEDLRLAQEQEERLRVEAQRQAAERERRRQALAEEVRRQRAAEAMRRKEEIDRQEREAELQRLREIELQKQRDEAAKLEAELAELEAQRQRVAQDAEQRRLEQEAKDAKARKAAWIDSAFDGLEVADSDAEDEEQEEGEQAVTENGPLVEEGKEKRPAGDWMSRALAALGDGEDDESGSEDYANFPDDIGGRDAERADVDLLTLTKAIASQIDRFHAGRG